MIQFENNTLRISLNYERKAIIIEQNNSPPGWKPLWEEVKAFYHEDEMDWYESSYSQLAEDEDNSILWFWSDIQE